MTLHSALVAIFGGEPDDIRVPFIDSLCCTLTPDKVRSLLNAVGGEWAGVLTQIDERQAERQRWLDGAGAGYEIGKEAP